ncbi:MAG: MGMT family protein [Actinomycetota bacterium]|nr:MGMT family protein [Actinomycetota bacterium]
MSDDEREAYVESVLRVVEAIPPGRVMAYGDVARAVAHSGPRRVGRVLSQHGGGVPWWRVVRADGGLPQSHRATAPEHYRAERTPLRSGAAELRVDMAAAAWNPGNNLLHTLPTRR